VAPGRIEDTAEERWQEAAGSGKPGEDGKKQVGPQGGV